MGIKKRLLMISLDAVSSDDLELLRKMPNFSALCDRGTLVRDVNSVFISNTYPAHTAIITGMLPASHGICDNVYFIPGRSPQRWRVDSREIKVPTLYQKAHQAGMTIASILYPVTGNADIDWNFPEIAEQMGLARRIYLTLRYGSPRFLIASLARFGKQFTGVGEPALDDFTTTLAVDTLVRHKPDLFLLHLIDTDSQKHDFGPDSAEAKASLTRHDARIGRLLDALRTAGTDGETGIIVFSDHGCLPVHTTIEPNDFLAEQGFYHLDNGTLLDFDAEFHSSGGTAFLRIYNSAKADSIKRAFDEFLEKPYVSRLLTEAEMRVSGMAEFFDFGVVANEGYSFGETHLGQHGYTLDREHYQPFYLAAGDGIPENQELSGGSIPDICPLAAEMLGLPVWKMDGVNRISA